MAEQPLTQEPPQDNNLKNGRLIPKLWNWVDVVAITVIFFVLFIVSQVGIFLALGENGDPFILILLSLGSTLVASIVSVLVVNAVRAKHSLLTLGLRYDLPKEWIRTSVYLGFGAALIRMAIIVGLFEVFPSLEEGAEALNQAFVFDQLWQSIVVGLAATFIVPIYEELFFRGFIHNGLRNSFGMWGAIIGSSLLFGLFHIIPAQVITAFLLGLVLGWLYEKSGSLWAVILCHVVNNGLAMLLTIISSQMGWM